MDQKETDFDALGRFLSLNAVVAFAVAASIREHDDPRGTAFDILSAVEAQLAESISKLRGVMSPNDQERLDDAARHNTLAIGTMVDAFLTNMGAPPREPE
ncbi:hypothetical protein [Xanthomonas arboricola]|uniref:hypothetical protein n=1 Tax=Xanthomonas arboricola TaxID=56448 RepID=UPI0011B0C801|nr:hypothetical protein [Xanthomonas arboricola]